jgi:Fe2+ transport system protein FeoA
MKSDSAARIMPLAMVSVGEHVRLVKVNAGEKLVCRLGSMGLTPGVEMRVLQDSGGPKTVCVRDSRIALGKGVAHKILVELI